MNVPICLQRLRFDLVIFSSLLIASLGVGLTLNQFRNHPLPLIYQTKAERLQDAVKALQPKQASTTATFQQILPEKMGVDAFSDYVKARRGLILDARPELFYRLGHVPGALSLPREDFERGYAALGGKLQVKRFQPIVIYCSDAECEDSKLVRETLKKLGYTNLSLFEAGWRVWSEAGKPVEVSR